MKTHQQLAIGHAREAGRLAVEASDLATAKAAGHKALIANDQVGLWLAAAQAHEAAAHALADVARLGAPTEDLAQLAAAKELATCAKAVLSWIQLVWQGEGDHERALRESLEKFDRELAG